LEDLAETTIDTMLKLGAEFADLRLERASGTNIVVMDGRTKTLTTQQESGCGLRAFIGGAWGFASTSLLTPRSMRDAATSAVKMAKAAKAKAKLSFDIASARAVRRSEEYRCKERQSDVSVEEKLRLVLAHDKTMRDSDPRISSTNARYDDLVADRIVANSFGTLAKTKERWLISACSAWAKSEGVVQRGHASVGSVGGYELMRTPEAQGLGVEAAAQALRLLDSKPAPAGKFTCILDNKMTGMLAHEAFGHACEADAILAGASVLEGRLGQKVANEQVTLIDDPTMKDTFGYFSIDWEGVSSKKHVLIEDGILKGFMHNLESSSRMGVAPNGSSRAQSFGSTPIIRMSNTFIGAGDWNKDEMIGELKHGLLIQGNQYGYVEPAKGQFMFKCDEAYEVKNGEIGQRFRDASLSGLILEVLTKVEGLADDFSLGDPGYCGKGGQSARTTDGGPHMRVADMVVGGLA
jgi:TldD protein